MRAHLLALNGTALLTFLQPTSIPLAASPEFIVTTAPSGSSPQTRLFVRPGERLLTPGASPGIPESTLRFPPLPKEEGSGGEDGIPQPVAEAHACARLDRVALLFRC